MTESRRPRPVPDGNSAPFWTAAGEHTLIAARCSHCGMFSHPPDIVCPHCGSTDPQLEFTPLRGRGAVRSWTVVRQALLPGFEADLPFVLVDVELDDQPDLRFVGRLLDGPEAAVRLGSPVRVAFEDLADGVAVPAFVLAEDA